LQEERKKIHAAKSILIVGAGFTGVETAGYLAKNFGK
jgi:NADH dehydrogenase FAD-containing subunit